MEQNKELIGNDKIEEAIVELQQNPCDELLAHTLTVIRRRMKEGGHLIVGVNNKESFTSLSLSIISTSDGKKWFTAFTGFEEELKGSDPVMSAFTSDIEKLLRMALETNEVEGLIINPWNKTIMLDKLWIKIIFGEA